MIWTCRDFRIDLSRARVMGIVNVTPDSFSDGGRYATPEEAFRRAANCADEGADILDIGGESTRPGAEPISADEEWSRIAPVLPRIVEELGLPVSVDTYHPETAHHALEAGAAIVNCVYAKPAAEMAALARETGAGLIVPAECIDSREVADGLDGRIVADPMIGFGTTREEDIALLGGLRRLAARIPVCVGVSRKRIVKRLVGEKVRGKNLGGTLGAAIWCAMNGASVVRVHDVAETVQALRVAQALAGAGETEQIA